MAITPWVRQYTLRELLDDSFDLFRERASALLLAGMLPMLLVVLYTAAMRLFVMPEDILRELTWEAFTQALGSGPLWGYLLGYTGVLSAAIAVGNIVQIRLAHAQAMRQPAEIGAHFTRLGKPCWSMLVVMIAYSLFSGAVSFAVVIVAAMLLAIGGAIASSGSMVAGGIAMFLAVVLIVIIALCALALVGMFFLYAPVVLALEHTGPFTAIGKSFRYSSANFKATYSALVAYVHIPALFVPLVGLVAYLLTLVTQHLSPTLTAMLATTIMSGVATVVFFAMFSCFQTLAYLDARCRAESYDLVLLAQDIGLGDEVEQLFARPAAPLAAAGAGNYPNYMATPTAPIAPTLAHLAPPQPSSAFPDYAAAPPPAAEASPAPAPEAIPAAVPPEGEDPGAA